MKKFEELMSESDFLGNIDAYVRLRNDMNRKKNSFVCFYGSGLTLCRDYGKWEFPFVTIYHTMNKRISIASKKIKDSLDKLNGGRIPLEEADKEKRRKKLINFQNASKEGMILLGEADQAIKEENYQTAGDLLDECIKKTSELIHECGVGDAGNYRSFNHACSIVFHDPDVTQMEIPAFESPFDIAAIYYLPFLGVNLLTTNVEESFDRVCDETKQDSWNSRLATPDMKMNEFFKKKNIIFYIHGKITNYETMVMTKTDYERMYHSHAGEPDSGAREILKHIAQNMSVLFLGASLQKDETVKVINSSKAVDQNGDLTDGRHFTTIVQQLPYGIGMEDDPQIGGELIEYESKEYQEIASFLLQLIRETADNWKNCSWTVPKIKKQNNAVPEKFQNEMRDFLTKEDPIAVITEDECSWLKKLDKKDILDHIYTGYSVYGPHENNDGWNICIISEDQFKMTGDTEELQPLHNYPLGDTIYIILPKLDRRGYPTIYKDEGSIIVDEIKQKVKSEFLDENGEYRKNARLHLKVRIIVFPLGTDHVKESKQEAEETLQRYTVPKKPSALLEQPNRLSKKERQAIIKAIEILLEVCASLAEDNTETNTKTEDNTETNTKTEDNTETNTNTKPVVLAKRRT